MRKPPDASGVPVRTILPGRQNSVSRRNGGAQWTCQRRPRPSASAMKPSRRACASAVPVLLPRTGSWSWMSAPVGVLRLFAVPASAAPTPSPPRVLQPGGHPPQTGGVRRGRRELARQRQDHLSAGSRVERARALREGAQQSDGESPAAAGVRALAARAGPGLQPQRPGGHDEVDEQQLGLRGAADAQGHRPAAAAAPPRAHHVAPPFRRLRRRPLRRAAHELLLEARGPPPPVQVLPARRGDDLPGEGAAGRRHGLRGAAHELVRPGARDRGGHDQGLAHGQSHAGSPSLVLRRARPTAGAGALLRP